MIKAIEALMYQEKVAARLTKIGVKIVKASYENKRLFDEQAGSCGFLVDDEDSKCLKDDASCRMSRCPYIASAMGAYRRAQGR